MTWTAFVDPFRPGHMDRPHIEWLKEEHPEMFYFRDVGDAVHKFVNCGWIKGWSLLEFETDGELQDCALFVRVK